MTDGLLKGFNLPKSAVLIVERNMTKCTKTCNVEDKDPLASRALKSMASFHATEELQHTFFALSSRIQRLWY